MDSDSGAATAFGGLPAALIAALILIATLTSDPVRAHRMDYSTTTSGDAVVVSLSYPFGQTPMFEPYRVYAPGSDIAFQTGRTDRLGRISFVPDRAGDWRVTIATEDGHGIDATVRVDEGGAVAASDSSRRGGPEMVLAGVGYVVGVAGLVVLLGRRRRAREPRMDRIRPND